VDSKTKAQVKSALNSPAGNALLDWLEKRYVSRGVYANSSGDGIKAAMDTAYNDGQAEVVRELRRLQQSGDNK
jgi:hypothetical protein